MGQRSMETKIKPNLRDLILHRGVRPTHARHGRLQAVAVACLLDGAHVEVQRAESASHLLAELPQRLGDVFGLRHPDTSIFAALARLAGDLGQGHTACVNLVERAQLQRVALLADPQGAKLAPLFHESCSGRGDCRGQPCIVLCNVLCFRLGQLVVGEELLLHAVSVGLAALLVRRDLFVAQIFEGPLAAAQCILPSGCHRGCLCLYRGVAGPGWLAPLALQGLLVKVVSPLIWDQHQRCIVHMALAFVFCTESFEGRGDVLPATGRVAGFLHLLRAAEQTFTAFHAAPSCFTDLLRREDARHPLRGPGTNFRHGTVGPRRPNGLQTGSVSCGFA